jgi:hypothetical protein
VKIQTYSACKKLNVQRTNSLQRLKWMAIIHTGFQVVSFFTVFTSSALWNCTAVTLFMGKRFELVIGVTIVIVVFNIVFAAVHTFQRNMLLLFLG